MVGRLINDLETHVYVSETHNYKDAYESQNSLLFICFKTVTF
jgi:hypothetical protein